MKCSRVWNWPLCRLSGELSIMISCIGHRKDQKKHYNISMSAQYAKNTAHQLSSPMTQRTIGAPASNGRTASDCHVLVSRGEQTAKSEPDDHPARFILYLVCTSIHSSASLGIYTEIKTSRTAFGDEPAPGRFNDAELCAILRGSISNCALASGMTRFGSERDVSLAVHAQRA